MSRTPQNPFTELRALASKHIGRQLPLETVAEQRETDRALHTLTPTAEPQDLQLRLRLALSHERVRADRRWFGRLSHNLYLLRENTLRRFAVQGTVAFASVLLLVAIGAKLGAIAPGQTVEANDIPLIGFSSPHYLYSSSGLHGAIVSGDESPIVVEAMVNSAGRVYDYRVLSGSLDPAGDNALRERMLSGVFKPARVLGEPVRGRVVLTFADIEVHA